MNYTIILGTRLDRGISESLRDSVAANDTEYPLDIAHVALAWDMAERVRWEYAGYYGGRGAGETTLTLVSARGKRRVIEAEDIHSAYREIEAITGDPLRRGELTAEDLDGIEFAAEIWDGHNNVWHYPAASAPYWPDELRINSDGAVTFSFGGDCELDGYTVMAGWEEVPDSECDDDDEDENDDEIQECYPADIDCWTVRVRRTTQEATR